MLCRYTYMYLQTHIHIHTHIHTDWICLRIPKHAHTHTHTHMQDGATKDLEERVLVLCNMSIVSTQNDSMLYFAGATVCRDESQILLALNIDRVCMSMYVMICMCACVCWCVHSLRKSILFAVSMCMCVCACIYVCLCMYACVYLSLYPCMYVCMYVCRHVCTYVYFPHQPFSKECLRSSQASYVHCLKRDMKMHRFGTLYTQ